MSAQLVARDLRFAHGPLPVLSGVSLTVAPGHRIGVIGPNGSGKSTLLALLTGTLVPDAGTIEVVPGDATVGHLTQELAVGATETVVDVVGRRTGIAAAAAALDRATAALASGDDVEGTPAADAYDRALTRWMRLGGAELDHRLDATLARVGLADPAGARRRDQPARTLSGGERARVNLASVLLSGFDVLALDEPTNDLDLAGLALLEEFLLGADAGFVLVSHDRAFLERVVTSVVEIDDHAGTATRYDGGWDAYVDARRSARRHAEEAYGTYVERRDALRGQAQRTREWSAQGIAKLKRSGEPDKHVRAFDRASSEKLVGKAKRAEKALERLETVDKPWEGWELRLDFATTGRSGDRVAEARDLVVDRRGPDGDGFVLGPVSLSIGHGERVALLGPNGSGKTTLLHALLGRSPATSGSVTLGPSVVVGSLDQARSHFSGDLTLLDAFVAETGISTVEARSQLAKLGLGPEHVARPTGRLSPGERTRAVLAGFALVGGNLLVLDEPTNHLDLPAIEQLEQALDTYPGTLILVTHDRRMLEHVHTTRTVRLAAGQVVADDPT